MKHNQNKKTVDQQVQETINGISSLADINRYGEQIVRLAQNHPELRDQIGDLLQGRRESLKFNLRNETRTQLSQADLATLNGPLSLDSIRKSFIEAGMTDQEAGSSVQLIESSRQQRLEELEAKKV